MTGLIGLVILVALAIICLFAGTLSASSASASQQPATGVRVLAAAPEITSNKAAAGAEVAPGAPVLAYDHALTRASEVHGAPSALDREVLATEGGGTVDLYHATSAENAASIRANGIDLSASRSKLDFGEGFYTTADPDQAAGWAARLEKRGVSADVLHYQVPESELGQLNGVTFDGPTPAWEDMVRSQRLGGPPHGYDYVEGPMVGRVQGAYGAGPIEPWGHQLSVHTQRAASLLDGFLR